MRRFHVYNRDIRLSTVDADKVFFTTGNLTFYNKDEANRFSDLRAFFALGSFTHVINGGEVSECTSSSSSFPVPTPEAPELSPQEAAWSAS